MKGFLRIFRDSALEFSKVRSVVVTAMFVAVSMIIETFTVDLVYTKLNFAFLAIAVIGMLFGPCMGTVAGVACDLVGYLVHPDGGYLPAYTLVAALQGFIYGLCLYYKADVHTIAYTSKKTGKRHDLTLYIRAIIARLIDVVLINLLINTQLNLHYGFIPDEAYSAAIATRVVKNLLELVVDIPLLCVLLPVTLTAYRRVFCKSQATNPTS